MAVLVEATSVIVRRDSIDRTFAGGWRGFLSCVPNATLCTDGQLARVGFMDPKAVESFVNHLRSSGLVFLSQGECIDLAVVDQQRGLTMPCGWLEFARMPFGEKGGQCAACWLFEGLRLTAGIHFPGESLDIATPEGWKYAGSLSERFSFVPTGAMEERLKYLRTENGVDVFFDASTGRECFKPRD